MAAMQSTGKFFLLFLALKVGLQKSQLCVCITEKNTLFSLLEL